MAKKTTKDTKELKKITCEYKDHKGKRLISEANFYKSKSPMFPDGRVHVCKKCLKNMIDYNDMETIYRAFQILDIPFFYNRWKECESRSENRDIFGNYVRMANSEINEFKGARYSDSVFCENENNSSNNNVNDDSCTDDIFCSFKVTKEMYIRWGTNYKKEEYFQLENFYNDMKSRNQIETPQDMDYLKKLSIISMKMNEELSNGSYGEAKKLGDLFSKYMADSGFRAVDKNDADKTGGIRNFSTIYMEVEKDDFIPPWEFYRKIKGIKQDVIDKTIMHIENFTCKLNKIEKMTEPPIDTPKLEEDEIDG